MKLFNFTIIKLTFCLIIGIIIGYNYEISLKVTSYFLLLFLLGLIITYALCYKQSRFIIYLFGAFTLLSFISVGTLTTKIYDDTLKDSHYVNSNINFSDYQNITFRIDKRLKPDNYSDKYFAEIISLNNNKHIGKILLNIEKDSLLSKLKIGDYYFTKNKLVEVVKPKNLFQFDYNNYLKKRNIHHQVYVKKNDLLTLHHSKKSLEYYSDTFRNTINFRLIESGLDKEPLAIINALLLGQRQDISSETYNNYVNAGVIHILAVSGLHVGIIYFVLSFLLKPLHRFRYGKHLFKPLLIILFLWSFAFITGLSPSVTRAVTMFSIITCAQFLKRPTNIYNTLTISAFIMLVVKPTYLFDVGFQMSYLAVLAIVTIQPMLYKLITIPRKIPDYFWQIFTVTVAAQIGVAPISLFYFHQFPGLFFVSNLVIIPAVTLILSIGILIIILAVLNSIPTIFVDILSYFINQLNAFIGWIAKFEYFLLTDISFSLYNAIGLYFVIITIIYYWKTKHQNAFKLMLLSVLILSGVMVGTKYIHRTDEFIIFNKNRKSMIGQKQNSNLLISHNLDSISFNTNKILKNYMIGNFITRKISTNLKSVYTYDSNILLVIDSLSVYNVKGFKPNYILLTNSPKINLNRLIDSLKPKHIIADGSNYKSYIKRWKLTCADKKIPFHSTYEKGAFVLK